MKQRGGKLFKIIYAIVLIIIIAIDISVLYRNSINDPYMGVEPDVVRIEDSNRPAEGQGTLIPLGNTEFCAGFHLYMYTDENDKEWDYYTVDVSRKKGDTYCVFFERQLDISDVPEDIVKAAGNILSLREDRVITFNEDSGIVTFTVGEKTFKYKLPEN